MQAVKRSLPVLTIALLVAAQVKNKASRTDAISDDSVASFKTAGMTHCYTRYPRSYCQWIPAFFWAQMALEIDAGNPTYTSPEVGRTVPQQPIESLEASRSIQRFAMLIALSDADFDRAYSVFTRHQNIEQKLIRKYDLSLNYRSWCIHLISIHFSLRNRNVHS